MRIILIPGFTEDEFIFSKILDKLPGEKLFLSLWDLLPNKSINTLNAEVFANELIGRFQISKSDLIVGHSLGGWIALHIKNIVGCPIVQIASWTDKSKVVTPFANRHIIYITARTGIFFNRFVLDRTIKKYYYNKPSKEVFEAVFIKMMKGNRANVVNQLRLLFNPCPNQIKVQPDLRIHARNDVIIRFPNEPVYEVDGDHFSLYTYPEQVYPPILDLINQFAKE